MLNMMIDKNLWNGYKVGSKGYFEMYSLIYLEKTGIISLQKKEK